MDGTTVKITFKLAIQAPVAVSGLSRILEDLDSSDLSETSVILPLYTP